MSWATVFNERQEERARGNRAASSTPPGPDDDDDDDALLPFLSHIRVHEYMLIVQWRAYNKMRRGGGSKTSAGCQH